MDMRALRQVFRVFPRPCAHACCAPPPFRTMYEDSGPGRPLSCFMEEPAPYTDSTGAAAGGGNCRFGESPSQDQRLQAQRLRNPEIRGSLQTPQNRPHGHQSPELPEGYGERTHPLLCALSTMFQRALIFKPFCLTCSCWCWQSCAVGWLCRCKGG